MLSITLIIVIITSIISFTAFSNEKITNDFIFYPPAISRNGQWYRFITCGLIHAEIFHLFFNMWALYSFGSLVESVFIQIFGVIGKWIYLLMYVTALVASLLPTYNRHKHDAGYRSLGASGAVSAVMFAGLLLMPDAKIGMFFIPIGIPGFLFGPLYLLLTAYMDRRGNSGINHSAHLWGALYGLAFTIVAGYAGGFPVLNYFVESVQAYFSR
ncbi:Membrane associated serine protease, rhomboid family [Cnuella takakiae]|uniref:Membrane associated serine protease, rhomboid family n=1 Tax=Cnuella takakiae TaxID=1302690 RepID=A0A1M4Y0X3_9BACT|nr:rhomboid family intramembrane serine protease [Cnuella takakiae]OLY93013.1 rhomboid family intramembrane serine protease [Cnuella takakiae]SHE99477.1 Membrane associated serine protease, rhomboid family [Cnuella takakiae]